MSDVQDMPAGLIARSCLDLVRAYAKGEVRDGTSTADLLNALAEKTQAEVEAARQGTGQEWALFTFGYLANPWMAIPSLLRWISGGDLSCTILVINDLPAPLVLEECFQSYGTQEGRPLLPTSPARRDEIPGRRGDALCGMGMFKFAKSTFLGIGTAGTTGVLQFQAIPEHLPRGLRIGWDTPFALGSANRCAVSLERQGSLSDWSANQVVDRAPSIHSTKMGSVSASCAHNTEKGTVTLLTLYVHD